MTASASLLQHQWDRVRWRRGKNNKKVDYIETGRIVVSHLLP